MARRARLIETPMVHPKVQQKTARLADKRGAGVDQTAASAMKRLDVLLHFVLGRHEFHIRLAHRRANRLGVVSVALLMLDEGLHVLRRNDPDRVAERLKLTLPEEDPCASLDPNHTSRKLRKLRQQLIPPQALAHHQPPFGIGTVHLEHALRQIDTHASNHYLLLPSWRHLSAKSHRWQERRPSH
jgi:hypothetical protein